MIFGRHEVFAAMRSLPLALLAAAVALAGCSDILPKPAPPPALYRLTAAGDFPAGGAPASIQLLIEAPSAEAALDTPRIALSRSATTLDYFADSAWTDRLPALWQPVPVSVTAVPIGPRPGQAVSVPWRLPEWSSWVPERSGQAGVHAPTSTLKVVTLRPSVVSWTMEPTFGATFGVTLFATK